MIWQRIQINPGLLRWLRFRTHTHTHTYIYIYIYIWLYHSIYSSEFRISRVKCILCSIVNVINFYLDLICSANIIFITESLIGLTNRFLLLFILKIGFVLATFLTSPSHLVSEKNYFLAGTIGVVFTMAQKSIA